MSKSGPIIALGTLLMAAPVLGCGKTDVRFTANGRLVVTPAWDDATPANGFRAVDRKLPKCRSQGYEMAAASTAVADEATQSPVVPR